MSFKSLNQKGVGAVEALLVVLIVAILGGTGYYVYHANKTTNDTLNSAAKDASGNPKFNSKKTTKQTSSQQYLTIKEFGVKLKLTADINDAYYAIRSNDPTIADLSTRSLTDIDPECAATASSTAAVSYFTDPQASTETSPGSPEQTNAQVYPNAVHIGDKYFYVVGGNGLCSEKSDAIAKHGTARAAFVKAEITAAD